MKETPTSVCRGETVSYTACKGTDHRKEEQIITDRRYNTRDPETVPDTHTPPAWTCEDVDDQPVREHASFMASCKFDLARLHLSVWGIVVGGAYNANGGIRYAAWDGRDYETSPKPTDQGGDPLPRAIEGIPSYRKLEDQYGVARCTLERAYEQFVATILPYTRDGALQKIDRVLQNRMAVDLGDSASRVEQCDWLETLSWSFGELHEVLIRRCPMTRAGRDPVRAMAYHLLAEGRISKELAGPFNIPTGRSAETLAAEYADIETVVGRDSMSRIMALLGDSLS